MDFLITNFEFENGKKAGKIFYLGTCVKEKESLVVVAESADWRCFRQFDETLALKEISEPIIYDDFYFLAKYDILSGKFQMQTDLIAYESVYYYNMYGIFAMSDNPLELIKVLKNAGISIKINSKLAKFYIAYNTMLLNDTIFEGIRKLQAASIFEILPDDGWKIEKKVYNEFKMDGELISADRCAEVLYESIKEYFKSHIDKNMKYSIGLSGGLDSRVGAYFAMEYGIDIQPIFIGVEKNRFGIRTYDSTRAEEVRKYLGMKKIKYYDPRTIKLSEKIRFDALHAPTMIDNTSQNLGKIPEIKVLINGIIGGDAFGYFVDDKIFNFNDSELADFILNNQILLPEYRSQFLRRITKAFSAFRFIRRLNHCSDDVVEELLSKTEREEAKKRIYEWVLQEKSKGLDNLNIWHKFYYYNYAAASKTSYYSSLSNTVPSFATFLNPGVIRNVILKSKTDLYKSNMPIQLALYKKLGGLGDIRSQKPEGSVNARREGIVKSKTCFVLERIIRGSGMDYPKWFSKSELRHCLAVLCKDTEFAQTVRLKNQAWLNNDQHSFLCLIKLAWIEKNILNRNS